ncbi:signal peptide peptidase SppA [Streptoalloteichus tenebrarius]|uniref:Signal peptide peptidase SppA n=1 Tax=Streptoalloteichus tenebrarius (strain ATCC 17920 / DSM 40477 / JCM 4838 / CBS 697.72 / NBRC 16177 / NCIMB 11028 / NRRL B-12390 / A12253. 1 / ISP 5477) TaxID=1933 RepID=A0ABT1HYE4_STRSD|nr:S49 family peptidase [Streptoalloteichus tenebrarius]MCP2260541.1 signal peptide peptidase SppA [Streptoalloteichus tenebrarius]BFF01881.1 S49 family peptidase [Streptoalloteichus tenebrarius]
MNVAERLASRLPGRLGERAERPVVAVVRLHGVITPTPTPVARATINTHAVETALTRAFGHDRLVAVALEVNSPGGAPTQSALIADRVRGLAAKKNVPVLAFCEDVAASGGYWLACAADEIYAHPTSLVGSIGVVSAGFGLAGLLERFGVERRVHTAGEHKARLDPFQPEKPEDVAWLKAMQADLHAQFVEWVRERRGGRLRGEEADLFSGEVWTGAKALDLGLVDGLGTMRGVVGERWPDATVAVAEPRRPLLARLGLGGAAARFGAGPAEGVLGAIEALEHRAVWSRFGL